ncbi:MAG: hypothetical protein K2L82_12105 [Lachnospiraceae bacterium]|nr:hypothetical protein [Lachnospiraceae bacterium]
MAVFFGASEGLQPLFGQSYGAKKKEDLKFYFKAGLNFFLLVFHGTLFPCFEY